MLLTIASHMKNFVHPATLCLTVLLVSLLSTLHVVSSTHDINLKIPIAEKPLICFAMSSAGNRGVQVSVYDYMHFTETQLGYPTLLLLPSNVRENCEHHPKGNMLTNFIDRFRVFIYPLKAHAADADGIPELSYASVANQCQVYHTLICFIIVWAGFTGC